MIQHIRYESDITAVDYSRPTVFLAGPTVRGNQQHLTSWRFDAIDEFNKTDFNGNLIIPEFTDKAESDQYRYDLPPWEFHGLSKSHVIMFWVPRTRELIGLTTNFEFGYWMAKEKDKVVYGRPDNHYRNVYLDIMWVEDSKQSRKLIKPMCPIYNTLQKTVKATIQKLITQGRMDAE